MMNKQLTLFELNPPVDAAYILCCLEGASNLLAPEAARRIGLPVDVFLADLREMGVNVHRELNPLQIADAYERLHRLDTEIEFMRAVNVIDQPRP